LEGARVSAVASIPTRRVQARFGALRLEAADRRHRNRLRGELLDAPDHAAVHALGERHREAVAAGATAQRGLRSLILIAHR
jgi:hypothetical protein